MKGFTTNTKTNSGSTILVGTDLADLFIANFANIIAISIIYFQTDLFVLSANQAYGH